MIPHLLFRMTGGAGHPIPAPDVIDLVARVVGPVDLMAMPVAPADLLAMSGSAIDLVGEG